MGNKGFHTTAEGSYAIIGPVGICVHADGTHILIQLPLQLATCVQLSRESVE